MKLCCGLDIHKKFHVCCIMDEKGKIVKEGKFENSKDGIDGFFSGFAVKEVVMESTWNLGISERYTLISLNCLLKGARF